MSNNCHLNVLNLNIDQKLDLIEDIKNDDHIGNYELGILNTLSYDQDDEVRSSVAEIIDFDSALAQEILFRLADDEDYLVRTNACDSLRNNKSPSALEVLKTKVIKDKSSLVRGYAALSMADIIVNNDYKKQEFIGFFSDRLKKEKIVWVKICIYRSLYLMGCQEFLDSILTELDNRAYRNRCLVTHILADILTAENEEIIRQALLRRKEKENTSAVMSSIENILLSM